VICDIMDTLSVVVAIGAGLVIVYLTMPEVRLKVEQLFGGGKNLYVRTTANGLRVKYDGKTRKVRRRGGVGLKSYVELEDGLRLQPFVISLTSYSTGSFENEDDLLVSPEDAVFVYDCSKERLNAMNRFWGDDVKIAGDWTSESDNQQKAMNQLDEVTDMATKMLRIGNLNKQGKRDEQ